jgi:hypothetical protein
MPACQQAGALDEGSASGPFVAPLSTMRQGNIFDSVYGPGPRLTIVFGYIGYNELGPAWHSFRDSNPALKEITNPFEGVVSPIQVGSNAWLWFVPSGPGKGMTDGDLLSALDAIFDWAKERRIRFVATNGIRDVDHGMDKTANRASDDRRTSMLTKYLFRRERADRIQVEVVSLSDVFVRYWTT